VFSKPSIKALLRRYTLVQLFTDRVPPQYEPTTTAEQNRTFLSERFGTAQLPLYVIVRPQSDGGFQEIDRYDEGKINHIDSFAEFLRKHLPSQREITKVQADGI
jgi:hypothetical protein